MKWRSEWRRVVSLRHVLAIFVPLLSLWSMLQAFRILPIHYHQEIDPSMDSPQRELAEFSRRNDTGNFSGKRDAEELLWQDDSIKALLHFRNKRMPEGNILKRGIKHPFKRPRLHHYRPTIEINRKYPKVIFYVHIHKSAGTLFCRLAYKNRISANQKNNCNVQDDQYCCGGKDTLEAQREFANNTYYDLVATEREMYDSMDSNYYDYVVTLRDSKSRYFSHWSHLRRLIPVGPGKQIGGFGDAAWIFADNQIVKRHEKVRDIPAGVDPLGTFRDWYSGQPDNWNTRILCGAKCRMMPKFQISRELFNYTLQRADQFAHFLFVEDLEEGYNKVASYYRWQNYSNIAHTFTISKKANRRKDAAEAEEQLAKEEWDPLMSALDDVLYEFAQRKYLKYGPADLWKPFTKQHEVEWYFLEGPKLQCVNACCGNCTPY